MQEILQNALKKDKIIRGKGNHSMKEIAQNIYNYSPVWAQNLLVSAYGYKLYRSRYTGPVFDQVKRDIQVVNTMSAKEHNTFQAERLYEMIKHCRANVPYYTKLLAELGLTENDFTDTKHLKKLPILEKESIRKNPEQFRAKSSWPYMIQNTSGSTGTPLSLWVDEYTYKLAMALLIDHEQRQGVPFGARRATFAGRMIQRVEKMTPPYSRFNRAENQRLFSSYHINSDTFPYYDAELDRFQPEEIIGYPSAIYDLALQYLNHRIKPRFQARCIITNSESLLEWQKHTIESVFNCKIFDYYGTAEYLTFAGQCPKGNYHFNPLIGITEVIEAKGAEVEHLDVGEIIVTSITNMSMPLLRYRVGDTASFLRSECECGNINQHTSHIHGRIDDVIITRDGRKIGRIDHIFKGLSGIKQAQVVQKTLTKCIINIEKVNDEELIDEDSLKINFKKRTSPEISIEICYLSSIPKSVNGKFRSVVSWIGNRDLKNEK